MSPRTSRLAPVSSPGPLAVVVKRHAVDPLLVRPRQDGRPPLGGSPDHLWWPLGPVRTLLYAWPDPACCQSGWSLYGMCHVRGARLGSAVAVRVLRGHQPPLQQRLRGLNSTWSARQRAPRAAATARPACDQHEHCQPHIQRAPVRGDGSSPHGVSQERACSDARV